MLSLALLGCYAGIERHEPPKAEAPATPPDTKIDVAQGEATLQRLRRLATAEYDHVVSDLAGTPLRPSLDLPRDPRVSGFDNNAEALVVTSPSLDGFFDAAYAVAPKLVPAEICATETDNGRAGAEGFARSFGRRAYGRPLDEDEVTRLLALFKGGSDVRTGLERMVRAILLSPHFLYRFEIGSAPTAAPNAHAVLSAHEVASQLSFLLTGSRPDAELLDAADRGELIDAAHVRPHAERLLHDPRAKEQVRRFFRGWLDLSNFRSNNKFIRAFTPAVRDAMMVEADQFVDQGVWSGPRTLESLLLASRWEVPEALAPIYGEDLLEAPLQGHSVSLDPARRKGLFALPIFLATHATSSASSPINRGVFVLARAFCLDLGSPPPEAGTRTVSDDPTKTTRQKVDEHAGDPACSGCHAKIDPAGFGFENYDAIGRYRSEENGLPVDGTGGLVGTDVDGTFAGPGGLSERLVHSAAFRRCFLEHMFRFLEGRHTGSRADAPYLEKAFETDEHRIVDFVLAYATRPGFFVRGRRSP